MPPPGGGAAELSLIRSHGAVCRFRLFRQGPTPPEDGLYGIRNSGTKTSKVKSSSNSNNGNERPGQLFYLQMNTSHNVSRENSFKTQKYQGANRKKYTPGSDPMNYFYPARDPLQYRNMGGQRSYHRTEHTVFSGRKALFAISLLSDPINQLDFKHIKERRAHYSSREGEAPSQ